MTASGVTVPSAATMSTAVWPSSISTATDRVTAAPDAAGRIATSNTRRPWKPSKPVLVLSSPMMVPVDDRLNHTGRLLVSDSSDSRRSGAVAGANQALPREANVSSGLSVASLMRSGNRT